MPDGPETLWGPGLPRGRAGAQGAGGSHADFTNALALSQLCLSSWKQGGGRASGELGAWGKLSSKVWAAGSARSLHQGPGPCSPGPATVLGGGLCWDQQLRKIHTCLWRCGEATLCPWGRHESLKTRCGF